MPSHKTLSHRHLDVFLVYNHFCHMVHLKATASLLLLLFVLSIQFLVLILGLILHHFLILVDLLTLNHLLLLLIIDLCYLLYFFHHLTLLWCFLLFVYHSKNLVHLFSLLVYLLFVLMYQCQSDLHNSSSFFSLFNNWSLISFSSIFLPPF